MKLVEGGWPAEAMVGPTLPGSHYYDSAHFQRELDAIWFKTWLCAGRLEEIPHRGDYFTREIGKESVLCVRGQNDEVHTYYNVCRHRGSRICGDDQGHVSQGVLFCPYHSWGYSIDNGELVKTPNIPDDLEGFDRYQYPLFGIKTEVWQGFVWINFDASAPSLANWLGLPDTFVPYLRYHLDELKTGAQKTYSIEANWKLIMENALECYHCSTIHPELSRCTPPTLPRYWLHEVAKESRVLKHAGAMELAAGFERVGITGEVQRPLFRELTTDDSRRIFYFFIYPHVFFAMASDYVFLFTLWPTRPNHTVTRGYWLFEDEVLQNPLYSISDAVDFWDKTNQQDWVASELVQKGNESKAYDNGGVLIPNDWRVAKFIRYIQDQLETTSED